MARIAILARDAVASQGFGAMPHGGAKPTCGMTAVGAKRPSGKMRSQRRLMRFVPARHDDFTIQSGVTARPIAPRYVGRHAVELQFSPDLLVMERFTGPAQGTGESFVRAWTKHKAS